MFLPSICLSCESPGNLTELVGLIPRSFALFLVDDH